MPEDDEIVEQEWDGKTWSYSRVNTYLMCPFKWLFRYHPKYKIDKPKPIYFAYGVAVHSALEFYNNNRTLQKNSLLEEMMRVVDASFHEQRAEKNGIAASTSEIQESISQIKDLLSAYMTFNAMEGNSLSVIEAEKHVVREVLPGLFLQGYIDGITVDGKLVDYKTSGKKWAEGKEERELQPPFYSLLLDKDVEFIFDVMIKHQTITAFKSIDRRSVRTGIRDRMIALNLIKWVSDAVKADIFVPCINSTLCGYCDYKNECEQRLRETPQSDGDKLAELLKR